MACLRGLLPIVFVLFVALLSGCAAPSSVSATAAAGASSEAPPPGHVLLTGDVRSPGTISPEQLAALPQHTISVEYLSGDGVQQKMETGVLLSDLLPPDVLATTDRKNDLLAFGILAIGSDGYAALVSYGEVSPDFGNRGLLLATAEDGAALDRPRLVVPGDVKGGRYVSDVVELRVIRAG